MTEEFVAAKDGHAVPLVVEESEGAIGDVILCHGLTADRDEYSGLYVRAAAALRAASFNTFRFDYRGHGRSDLPSEQMTIAGETADLTAVMDLAWKRDGLPQYLLATSFGAVSAVQRLAAGADHVRGLVLWNPVIDVRSTFVDPGTPWSRTAVNDESRGELAAGAREYVLLDGFRLGFNLVHEMERTDITGDLRDLRLPILAAHGTADELVPYTYTEAALADLPRSRLISLPNAGHGFLEHQTDVLRETVEFLSGLARAEGDGSDW
ncbi:alpha/beta fold hydrolase [Micromonospora sp. NPDC005324]|uniref:alpha/beta fold hydrolase n=1 Tax=Micromonospora sp. NPDC005324 TaxID=3157033 RepID=UPI0033BA9FF0